MCWAHNFIFYIYVFSSWILYFSEYGEFAICFKPHTKQEQKISTTVFAQFTIIVILFLSALRV